MFKSKEQKESEAYDRAMTDALRGLPVLAGKWQYYCETLKFKDGVPLVQQVKGFAMPASQWAYKAYPSLAKTNPIPWFVMLFSAVRSGNTHSDAELNEAMASFAEETKLPPLDDLVNMLPRVTPVR